MLPWLILGAVVPSACVCWTAAWVVRGLGPRMGLVDRPGARKIHEKPMPTSGGLAIWLGLVVPLGLGQCLLWMLLDGSSASPAAEAAVRSTPLPEFLAATGIVEHLSGLWQQSGKLWLLLGGGTALMILGLADDRRGLDWRFRLAAQTAVAATMVACGWCARLPWDVPGLAFAVSVVWIVGLVNSFNMLDNMDGLSAGVAAIAAAILAAAALLTPRPDNHQPQLFVAGFLLLIVGSLLGFLGHNRPPARLFMGDAGSYLIGYLLAMATLTATFAGGGLPSGTRGLGAAVRDGRADLRYGQRRPHSLAPAAESLRRRQEPLFPSARQSRHDEGPGRADDLSRHRDLRPRGVVVAPGRFDRRDIGPLAGRLYVVAGRGAGKHGREGRE